MTEEKQLLELITLFRSTYFSAAKGKIVDGKGLCLVPEAGGKAMPSKTHSEVEKDMYCTAQSMFKNIKIKVIISSFRLRSM